MPDEELFRLADEGRAAQARRARSPGQADAQGPEGAALVENFAGQWLQLRNLKTLSPGHGLLPATGTTTLRQAMVREAELFFEHVVRDDRSVLDFLDADYTFVNDRLARHYGIADVTRRRVPQGEAARTAAAAAS